MAALSVLRPVIGLTAILACLTPMVASRPHAAKASVIELPLFQEDGTWYAEVDVGAAKKLKLAIQTGADVVTLNEGVYQPGPDATTIRPFHVGQLESDNYWNGTIMEDRVSIGDGTLFVDAQSVLDITSSFPANHPVTSGDGMLGFWRASSWKNTQNWFNNLCDGGLLAECRFALAQGVDGTGAQYFGGVQDSAFSGSLVTVPLRADNERAWGTYGDVVVDGKVVAADAGLYFASNTNYNAGPLEDVRAIFDAAGVESVSQTNGDQTILSGYYACDQPPSMGMQFPSSSDVKAAKQGKSGKVSTETAIFDFGAGSMESSRDGNNCTIALKGYSDWTEWTFGQMLFNGNYVDHNLAESTMAFAALN